LHRKNKVIIVLAIEIRHEPLLASEALIEEQILTIVGLCFGYNKQAHVLDARAPVL